MQWLTKEKDLLTARKVIQNYWDDAVDNRLGLQEMVLVPESGARIHRADWVIELEETFVKQYGDVRGSAVSRKVLTALLTQGASIH